MRHNTQKAAIRIKVQRVIVTLNEYTAIHPLIAPLVSRISVIRRAKLKHTNGGGRGGSVIL